MFLKFRKFQPGYSYKIYSFKQKSVFKKWNVKQATKDISTAMLQLCKFQTRL